MKTLLVVALVLAGWVTVLLGAPPVAADWTPHWMSRSFTIARHAEQLPRNGYVLLVGDSTLEAYRPETLCGMPVLNAAMGGASTYNLLVWEPWAGLHPAVVFILVGGNDVGTDAYVYLTDIADIVLTLSPAIDRVTGTVGRHPPVRLVEIPAPQSWGLGLLFDAQHIAAWNSMVHLLGLYWKIPVVLWPYPYTTVDGGHPTAATYADLTVALEAVCP